MPTASWSATCLSRCARIARRRCASGGNSLICSSVGRPDIQATPSPRLHKGGGSASTSPLCLFRPRRTGSLVAAEHVLHCAELDPEVVCDLSVRHALTVGPKLADQL